MWRNWSTQLERSLALPTGTPAQIRQRDIQIGEIRMWTMALLHFMDLAISTNRVSARVGHSALRGPAAIYRENLSDFGGSSNAETFDEVQSLVNSTEANVSTGTIQHTHNYRCHLMEVWN